MILPEAARNYGLAYEYSSSRRNNTPRPRLCVYVSVVRSPLFEDSKYYTLRLTSERSVFVCEPVSLSSGRGHHFCLLSIVENRGINSSLQDDVAHLSFSLICLLFVHLSVARSTVFTSPTVLSPCYVCLNTMILVSTTCYALIKWARPH